MSVTSGLFQVWTSSLRREFSEDSEEGRSRLFCGVFLTLLSPFLLSFACLHLVQREYARAAILACLFLGLLGVLFRLRTARAVKHVYRISILLLGAFSLFLVILSGVLGNTDRLLFLFLIPLFSLFTLGRREGLLWVLGLFAVWLPFFVAPITISGTSPPPTDFLLRFLATFSVVSGTAYTLEHIREGYQRTIEKERARLAEEVEERKRFERVLEERERKYRTLFETAGDAIFLTEVVDGDLRIKECNRAALDLIGCTLEEVRGKSTLELGAPERVERGVFLRERARGIQEVAAGATKRFEWRHRRLDGKSFETEVVLTPIEVDRTPHVLGLVRDITERKRAERSLKESERRFRELAALLPEIVFEVDRDGNVLFVNRNAFTLTGYSEEEFASGFDAFRVIAPEDRERVRRKVLIGLEDGKSQATECTAVRKNGEEFPVLIRSTPIISGNEISGVRGILVDMTDQKRSHRALVEAKEFSDSIINSLPGNFYVITEEGNALLWNRHVEVTSGYSAEEVGAMRAETFFVAEERERVRERIKRAFLEGELDLETRILTKEGREIPYHYRGLRVNLGGRVLLVGLGLDITGRLKSEEEKARLQLRLQNVQRMEAIGTLAGGIAHDFNNVLAVITGFTELALGEAEDGTPQKENLEEVLDASNRAKNLVQQILTFSRQEDRERAPLELQRIVKGTLKHVRSNLPKSVEMLQSLEAESGQVMGNAIEIHQMLIHLCTNALQAMEKKGGILEVRLTRDRLDPETAVAVGNLSPGAHLKLVVRDSGRGMDKAVLERIFDPFFTTRPPGEGTGMGLSVVHGIVSGLGGGISVSSRVGEGSSFAVWLPEMAEGSGYTGPGKPSPGVTQRGGRGETILVVDDEAQIRRMLRQMLEKEGFQVREASDGKEAIRMQAAEPADLVITDIFMPGTDGFETIRELRKGSSKLGIVAMSGGGKQVKEDLLPYAKMLGANRILSKPLERRALVEAIRGILGSR